MTLFHLNEMTYFDKNDIVLTKQYHKKIDDASSSYC